MSASSPATLPIRHLTPADLPACADLAEDRGWPRTERRWSLLLHASTGFGIDAPDGGLVAACVLTRYAPLDERQDGGSRGGEPGRGLGAIGMMLVAERYERQGVGRRLLRHVIDDAGVTPLTLYATPYGRPLYEQLGFKAIGRSETVQGRLDVSVAASLPAPAAGTASGGAAGAEELTVRRAIADDLPALLRLDADAFGVDRTHLITRLPAFADQVQVAERGGRITGFGASWPDTTSQVIGPLIAEDVSTAKVLISSLAAGTERLLRTDIDTRHAALLTWLKEHGLGITAVNTVMTYGTTALPGDGTRNFLPMTVATG